MSGTESSSERPTHRAKVVVLAYVDVVAPPWDAPSTVLARVLAATRGADLAGAVAAELVLEPGMLLLDVSTIGATGVLIDTAGTIVDVDVDRHR